MKRKRREIGLESIDEMKQKLARILRRANHSLRPVLVYEGELDPAVEGTGFFDVTLSAERLLT